MIWEFGIVVRVAPSWATEQRKLKEMHLGEKRKKKEKKEKNQKFCARKTDEQGRKKKGERDAVFSLRCCPKGAQRSWNGNVVLENIIF